MKKIKTISIIVLLLVGLAAPAYAIPSPDIIINLFSSAAHLIVVALAYCGGFFLMSKQQIGSWVGRHSRKLLVLFGVVFVFSLTGNFFQSIHYRQGELKRLNANLTRTSKQGGILVQDFNLKTMQMSDQLTHPKGISTDEFLKLLKTSQKNHKTKFIDIREPEEFKTSYIPVDIVNMRFPDLARDYRSVFRGFKKIIIFCESGNRSSELVNLFQNKGVQNAYFVIGGHEKWHAEKKPLKGPSVHAKLARDVPSYPNKETLLTTDEVETLYGDKGKDIVFIDTRYDTEFNFAHLPQAFQFPLRRLTSEEIDQYLQKIPKDKKVIGACYDKRSCFYAKVLGYKLTEKGWTYLGRYTVPWEFTVPEKNSPSQVQVASSKDFLKNFFKGEVILTGDQSLPQEGLMGFLYGSLNKILVGLHDRLGSWGESIIIFIFLCRLFLAPLNILSDRSAFIMKQLKPRVEEIRQEWASQPKQRSQETMRLYKEACVYPLAGLFAGVLQLLLFIGVYKVMNVLAVEMSGHSFGPLILDLADRDRTYLLPAFCALGILVIPFLSGSRKIPFVVFASLFFLFALRLQAAILLYLVTNIALLLVQQALTFSFLSRKQKKLSVPKDTRLVPLKGCVALSDVGAKAKNLGLLANAGFPVPRGFLLTKDFFQESGDELVIDEEQGHLLVKHFQKLGVKKVAVRSAAVGEDGASRSYAGLFESVLNVGEENYLEALRSVYLSFFSDRAQSYDENQDGNGVAVGILIQEMIEADYAGVVFTAHPQNPSALLVEMVKGSCDQLVSGKVTPDSVTFSRETLEVIEGTSPPIPLTDLVRQAVKIEKLFGVPQDIEWAYGQGKFYFLQSRPITALSVTVSEQTLVYKERERLLVKALRYHRAEPVWAQTELSEVLPRSTPLSLSLMRALWSPQGATGIASRKLGLPYSSHVSTTDFIETVFGWTYVNLFEEKQLTKKRFHSLNLLTAPFSSLRMERMRRKYEKDFFQRFLPPFLNLMEKERCQNLDSLSTDQLWKQAKRIFHVFVSDHYVHAEIVNLMAKYSYEVVRKSLEGSPFQIQDLLKSIHSSDVNKARESTELLSRVAKGQVLLKDYLKEFGHRAFCDYELSEPRFWEKPDQLTGLLTALKHQGCVEGEALAALSTEGATRAPMIEQEIHKWAALRGQVSQTLFLQNWEYLKKYEALKETAKHYLMMELDVLRRVFCKMSERRDIDLFYLTEDEVWGLEKIPQIHFWQAMATSRRMERECFEKHSLPPQVGVDELEGWGALTQVQSSSSTDHIRGICVSGASSVEGRARVLKGPEDLAQFLPGEILVAKFTEPAWLPIFKMAKGIVTEVGGALSHASILAREYNLTAIVRAQRATETIKTGDYLVLTPDGTVRRKEKEQEI